MLDINWHEKCSFGGTMPENSMSSSPCCPAPGDPDPLDKNLWTIHDIILGIIPVVCVLHTLHASTMLVTLLS